MKKIVLLVIAAVAFCISANAQIVSSHYYDMHGSPYFRADIMKSTRGDYHGAGINAAFGYYIPLLRSNFFYAPEIGLTSRIGSDRDSDEQYYNSYFGLGLKVVPLQLGYSLELASNLSINPRIGMAAAFIPIGSITHQGSGESKSSTPWDKYFEMISPLYQIGCDVARRDNNLILSFVMEQGSFTQFGVGLGIMF